MNAKRSKRPSDQSPSPDQSFPDGGYGEMPRPLEENGARPDRPPLASEFRDTAYAAGRAVSEQAASFASDLGHELGRKADEQKARGIEGIRAFAEAFRTAANGLEQQSPQVAQYVRDAAERVESLSGSIEGRSIPELLRNASDLARAQPTMFFVGAVAAGFALSRFLKSSAQAHEMNFSDSWEERSEHMQSAGGSDYGSP